MGLTQTSFRRYKNSGLYAPPGYPPPDGRLRAPAGSVTFHKAVKGVFRVNVGTVSHIRFRAVIMPAPGAVRGFFREGGCFIVRDGEYFFPVC